ncbi:MAG: DNA polymerase I, partial [Firmicutes bacterium]|nr:DNA polymerase I [Bacillota bacterium]
AEQGLERVLYEVELPLIEVLASMEVDGVRANAQFLDDFGVELKKQITEKEQEIYQYAGTEFNINSPIQLGDILFETLKLPAGKKTKRGYSTSADVLEKIRPLHPIVDNVLTYRNLAKLNSTYVEGMKPLICEDGRIRAHFQQNVTTTGRLSCTEPNLQNIPIRQELGRKLRQAFVAADENHTLVGADYSQIELRVLAHLSGDEVLIEAFNNGDDIHKLTASRVLGVPFDDVSLEQRSRAKAVNFGVIYGMSSFGLSEELNISRREADEYIKEYFRKHEKVKIYMDSRIADCKTSGYSETILGRKRMIPEIGASNFMVRQLGERLAMNTPIQGSAADIIKLAMIGVYRELKEHFPQSRLILQVHDELIIDCRNEELEEVKNLLVRCMESAMSLQVKLAAELNTGYSWYDLK